MRFITALLFSVITFLQVVGMTSFSSNELNQNLKNAKSQLTISTQQTHHAGDCGPDCTASESLCSTCHFGHCHFTITSIVTFDLLALNKLLKMSDIKIFTLDFHSNLFRPPIV